ncbi:hypothetical protein VTI74DRAFT_2768 [Chaetomium olivicolor]
MRVPFHREGPNTTLQRYGNLCRSCAPRSAYGPMTEGPNATLRRGEAPPTQLLPSLHSLSRLLCHCLLTTGISHSDLKARVREHSAPCARPSVILQNNSSHERPECLVAPHRRLMPNRGTGGYPPPGSKTMWRILHRALPMHKSHCDLAAAGHCHWSMR